MYKVQSEGSLVILSGRKLQLIVVCVLLSTLQINMWISNSHWRHPSLQLDVYCKRTAPSSTPSSASSPPSSNAV